MVYKTGFDHPHNTQRSWECQRTEVAVEIKIGDVAADQLEHILILSSVALCLHNGLHHVSATELFTHHAVLLVHRKLQIAV